jgi:hypothetical protein
MNYDSTDDLIFDITRCNVNITNIILIDSFVSQSEQFINSVNNNTLAIVYRRAASYDKLLEILNNENLINVKRIAFAFDNDLIESKYFINENPFFTDNDISPNTVEENYSSGLQTILNIIRTKQLLNIDFLACESLLSNRWKSFYNLLFIKTLVTVGASDNKTGNVAYGADWILESTHEDVKSIYWTDAINNYSTSLVVTPFIDATLIPVGSSSYPFVATSGNCIFLKNTAAKTITQQMSFELTSAIYGSTNVPLFDLTGGIAGNNNIESEGWVLDGNGFNIGLEGLGTTAFYSLVRSTTNTLYTVKNINIIGNLTNLNNVLGCGIIDYSVTKYVIMKNCYIHSTGNLTIKGGGLAGDFLGNNLGKTYITDCGVSAEGNIVINIKQGGLVGYNARNSRINGCYVYANGNITISGDAGGMIGYHAGYNAYAGGVVDLSKGVYISTSFVKAVNTLNVNTGGGGIIGNRAGYNYGFFSVSNCAVLAGTVSVVHIETGGIVGIFNGTTTSTDPTSTTPATGIIDKCAFIPTNLANNIKFGAIVGKSYFNSNLTVSNCYTSVNLPLLGSQASSINCVTQWTNCYTINSFFGALSASANNTVTNCVYGAVGVPPAGYYGLTVFDEVNVLSSGTLSSWNSDWSMGASNRPTLQVFQDNTWSVAFYPSATLSKITTDTLVVNNAITYNINLSNNYYDIIVKYVFTGVKLPRNDTNIVTLTINKGSSSGLITYTPITDDTNHLEIVSVKNINIDIELNSGSVNLDTIVCDFSNVNTDNSSFFNTISPSDSALAKQTKLNDNSDRRKQALTQIFSASNANATTQVVSLANLGFTSAEIKTPTVHLVNPNMINIPLVYEELKTATYYITTGNVTKYITMGAYSVELVETVADSHVINVVIKNNGNGVYNQNHPVGKTIYYDGIVLTLGSAIITVDETTLSVLNHAVTVNAQVVNPDNLVVTESGVCWISSSVGGNPQTSNDKLATVSPVTNGPYTVTIPYMGNDTYNLRSYFIINGVEYYGSLVNFKVDNFGTAGGDPYITTLENKEFYKLPGKIRNYRLFQSENCVINASVSPIKERDVQTILEAFKDVDGFKPKTDGFYFDSYYIQIGNDYLLFNERIELLESSSELNLLYVKPYPEVQTENINGMSSTYFLTEILVQDSSCNNVLIQLKRDLNPQIINGIAIQIGSNIKNTTGALIRRSNPRNYEIKDIKSVKLVNETKYPTSKNYHVKKETFYSKHVSGLRIH